MLHATTPDFRLSMPKDSRPQKSLLGLFFVARFKMGSIAGIELFEPELLAIGNPILSGELARSLDDVVFFHKGFRALFIAGNRTSRKPSCG